MKLEAGILLKQRILYNAENTVKKPIKKKKKKKKKKKTNQGSELNHINFLRPFLIRKLKFIDSLMNVVSRLDGQFPLSVWIEAVSLALKKMRT